MNTPYVGSIYVNGELAVTNGQALNIMGANGSPLNFDPTTNTLTLDVSAGAVNGGNIGKGGATTQAANNFVYEGTNPSYNQNYLIMWQSQNNPADYITGTSISDNGTNLVTINNGAGSATPEATISEANGTINVINGTYNIGGNMVLATPACGGGILPHNVYVGVHSGNLGSYNTDLTGLGDSTLFNSIGGSDNTAIGGFSMCSNQYGYWETAIGSSSLSSDIDGCANVAVGVGALWSTTGTGEWMGNGDMNTGAGFSALASNTTGENNTAVGADADVSEYYGPIANATAIGYNAIAYASNSIQLGNPSVDSVVTSGRIQTGTTGSLSNVAGSIIFNDGSAAGNLTTITVSKNQTQSPINYTLPTAQGSANSWLLNDGSGNLSWSSSGVTDSCVDNGTKWRHHLLKWYGINSYQTRRAETPAQNTRRTQATGSPACFAWRNA